MKTNSKIKSKNVTAGSGRVGSLNRKLKITENIARSKANHQKKERKKRKKERKTSNNKRTNSNSQRTTNNNNNLHWTVVKVATW